MLGYVISEKQELRVREFGVYQGYYCGLCKTIGRDYPQVLRTALSYDMAFLAILLTALTGAEEKASTEHCIAHHIAKRPVIRNSAVDYAADVMILLAYEKYRDDVRDNRTRKLSLTRENARKTVKSKLFAAGLVPAIRRAYPRAARKLPDLAAAIEEALARLHETEDARTSSALTAAGDFAVVMQRIFLEGLPGADEGTRRILSEFAGALGRWIYLADALDDLEEDLENGTYNPFLYEHDGYGSKAEDLLPVIREEAAILLYHELENAAKAYELLDPRQNRGILDNILYLGMRRKTDELLGKSGSSPETPAPKAQEETEPTESATEGRN